MSCATVIVGLLVEDEVGAYCKSPIVAHGQRKDSQKGEKKMFFLLRRAEQGWDGVHEGRGLSI